MKKSTLYSALCIAFMCSFLFSSVMSFASWKSQGDTINKITIASVKGCIEEEYEQNQVVFPNGTVEKVVKVKNTGTADAMIRVKVEKVWGDGRDENGKLIINPELDTDNIMIHYNTEKWVYNAEDGYYYYMQVLKPEDTTSSLFDSFTVNGNKTDGRYKNKHADIVVSMEMVQAAGGGLSYWGTSFEKLGIIYKQQVQTDIITTVDFKNPKEGFAFEVNDGDLFANFKNLVPGESRSQVVEITNKWNKDTEIFLWAEYIEQSQATDKTRELINKLLHENAVIVITDDNGTIIYKGAVWGNPDIDSKGTDSMKYPISLGLFAENQTKKLNISLYLDSQTDNEYMELTGLIKWVLSAEGTDTQEKISEPEKIITEKIHTTDSPKTGDSSGVFLYGVTAIISFLLMLITLRKAKKAQNMKI